MPNIGYNRSLNLSGERSTAHDGSRERKRTYRRIVNAWCMYDWANSAFATTILAAVLPIYYSQVAGATLPSEAMATAYWSVGLSVSPAHRRHPLAHPGHHLGRHARQEALPDHLCRPGHRRHRAAGAGRHRRLAAGLDPLRLGRIGFTGANVFYDALLPHVAREEDQDRVSTRGYAMGYLGGGLLLAINVVMIQFLPGTWGPRLSFLSVAIWWAVFSIPLLTPRARAAGRHGQARPRRERRRGQLSAAVGHASRTSATTASCSST